VKFIVGFFVYGVLLMDFNYLKYQLKSFFISDFRYKEICSILNDLEPEVYSREYLKSLNFNKEHENSTRIRFRSLIDTAYNNNVPLGLELGGCKTLEDAYVVRNNYLKKYEYISDIFGFFNKVIILLGVACFVFLLVMLG